MGEVVGEDHAALPHKWHGETTLPARVRTHNEGVRIPSDGCYVQEETTPAMTNDPFVLAP